MSVRKSSRRLPLATARRITHEAHGFRFGKKGHPDKDPPSVTERSDGPLRPVAASHVMRASAGAAQPPPSTTALSAARSRTTGSFSRAPVALSVLFRGIVSYRRRVDLMPPPWPLAQ